MGDGSPNHLMDDLLGGDISSTQDFTLSWLVFHRGNCSCRSQTWGIGVLVASSCRPSAPAARGLKSWGPWSKLMERAPLEADAVLEDAAWEDPADLAPENRGLAQRWPGLLRAGLALLLGVRLLSVSLSSTLLSSGSGMAAMELRSAASWPAKLRKASLTRGRRAAMSASISCAMEAARAAMVPERDVACRRPADVRPEQCCGALAKMNAMWTIRLKCGNLASLCAS